MRTKRAEAHDDELLDLTAADHQDDSPQLKVQPLRKRRRSAAPAKPDATSTAPTPSFRYSDPPPTIDRDTGLSHSLSDDERTFWESDAGGKAAAKREPIAKLLRRLGSFSLTLHFTGPEPPSDKRLSILLGANASRSYWRLPNRKDYKRPANGTVPPSAMETWHPVTGEVERTGQVLPTRLLQAVHDGDLMLGSAEEETVLRALISLQEPTLWGQPFVVAVGAAPKSYAPNLSLRIDVYASRLLLYLVANTAVLELVSGLRDPLIAQPLTPLPRHPRTWRSHGGELAAPFSLAGVLKSCEHEGHREESQPAGLALQLKQYQRQGLAWLLDMESEKLLPRGLNGLFWERREWADGGSFWYMPKLGELRSESPPIMRGGLLCDEMGLGKTVQVIALVLTTLPGGGGSAEAPRRAAKGRRAVAPSSSASQPSAAAQSSAASTVDDALLASRATLIVVPPTLVSQWLSEIDKSLVGGAGGALFSSGSTTATPSVSTAQDAHPTAPTRIMVANYTTEGLIRKDSKGSWRKAALSLADHDIVLTTYSALDRCAVLPTIGWYRIVLDEMQEVRSSTTELARKCERLHDGGRRWMVSGTPLFDRISDLRGELNFLRVSPFGASLEDGFWAHAVQAPWEAKEESALDTLNVLLRAVVLRRSKSQTHLDGTTPLLELPGRQLTLRGLRMAAAEMAVYSFVEAIMAALIGALHLLAPGAADDSLRSDATRRFAAPPSRSPLLVSGLRLLRECVASVHLLAGGAGCPPQLHHLDEMARAWLRHNMITAASGSGNANPGQHLLAAQLRRLTPSAALLDLSSADRHVDDVAQTSGMRNAQNFGDFERHSNATQRTHNRNRSYRLESVKEKLSEAEAKLAQLDATVIATCATAARKRWLYAMERISTGALLCASRLHASSGGSQDDDEGLHGYEHHLNEVEGTPTESIHVNDDLLRRHHSRRGTTATTAWLWLLRGARAVDAKRRVTEAEAELLALESTVMTPVLARHQQGVLVHEGTAPLRVFKTLDAALAAASAAAGDATQGDLVGDFAPGARARVVTSFTSEGVDGDATPATTAYSIAPVTTAARAFITSAPAPPPPPPVGWVINSSQVSATKLADACERAGLHSLNVQGSEVRIAPEVLELETTIRSLALRAFLKPHKSALLDARNLASFLPAWGVRGAVASLARRADAAEPACRRGDPVANLARLAGAASPAAPLWELHRSIPRDGISSRAPGAAPPPCTVKDVTERIGAILRASAKEATRLASARQQQQKQKQPRNTGVGDEDAPDGDDDAVSASLKSALTAWRELVVQQPAWALAPRGWRPSEPLRVALASSHPDWPWVQTSVLHVRGLPASATREELHTVLSTAFRPCVASVEAADADATAAPTTLAVHTRPDGLYVQLRTAAAVAKALEEARKPAGLPMPLFPHEERLVAEERAAAQTRVDELQRDRGAAKTNDEKKAVADAIAAAKKNVARLAAGRRAWAAVASLTSRASSSLGAVVDACGQLRTVTPALRLAADVIADLSAEVEGACKERGSALVTLSELKPYVEKLRSAEAHKLSDDLVSQSGYDLLLQLELGKGHNERCPICYDTAGVESSIVITRCAHFFCKVCLLSWMGAQRILHSDAADRWEGGSGGSFALPCPCCRKPFSLHDVIEVAENKPADSPNGATPKEADAAGNEGEGGSIVVAGPSGAAYDDATAAPAYSRAATLAEYEAMALPNIVAADRLLSFPSLPSSLLACMRNATGGLQPGVGRRIGVEAPIPSTKLQALLDELALLGDDPRTGAPHKVVVFTSHREAVKHTALVLAAHDIGCASVCAGDPPSKLADAVHDWNANAECRVFVLHAGAAAAGLTLVAASHIYLMEPFRSPGLELQALNRCHRIGQTNRVSCTIFFTRGTVEERLLALRAQQGNAPPTKEAPSAHTDSADSVAVLGGPAGTDAATARLDDLAFLFGVEREGE